MISRIFPFTKTRKNFHTRGQAEIIGITLVMILIMIGIIFVIRYVVLPEDASIKQAYDRNQLAANFMDALLKTTTHCNGLTMTELVQDCAEQWGGGGLYQCPATAGICAGGCTSCDFLNNSLAVVFEDALDPLLQFGYDFFICRWDSFENSCGTPIYSHFSNRSCLTRLQYDSKQQPIPTQVGNRVVQMYIC